MSGLWDCWNPRFQRFHGTRRGRRGYALTWGFACSGLRASAVPARRAPHVLCVLFPRAALPGPCGRCTRAWLPVAPGAAVDCLAGLRVCRAVRCGCAERPPLRRPTSPAHHVFRNSARRGGAGGPPGVRGEAEARASGLAARHMGRRTENARSTARSTGKHTLRLLSLPPRAHKRAPEQGGRDGPRLAVARRCGCCAALPRREGARAAAPTNKGRRKNRRPDVICVLSPVQLLPAVSLLVGPGIR